MKRHSFLLVFLVGLVFGACGLALAETTVDSEVTNDVEIDGKGVAVDNSVQSAQAGTSEFGASAADYSKAETDNSVEMEDSALTRAFLAATVSHNGLRFEDNDIDSVNEITDHAFGDARGIEQVSQNSAANGLVQQDIRVSANMDADLR